MQPRLLAIFLLTHTFFMHDAIASFLLFSDRPPSRKPSVSRVYNPSIYPRYRASYAENGVIIEAMLQYNGQDEPPLGHYSCFSAAGKEELVSQSTELYFSLEKLYQQATQATE